MSRTEHSDGLSWRTNQPSTPRSNQYKREPSFREYKKEHSTSNSNTPSFREYKKEHSTSNSNTPSFREYKKEHSTSNCNTPSFREYMREHSTSNSSTPSFREYKREHSTSNSNTPSFREYKKEHSTSNCNTPCFRECMREHSTSNSSTPSFREYMREHSTSSSTSNTPTSSSQYGDLPTSFHSSRNNNYEKLTRQDYENFERIVQEYFSKKFFFRPPLANWVLPEPEKMYVAEKWKIERQQELKAQLNAVKSKLDHYNLDDWHKHTRAMNKAGEILWKLRKEIEPEFITQAWCKFYENVMAFPLVPPQVIQNGVLNSVHLCEAPGAFITSLNHYLTLQIPGIKWSWQATTLNPYYEGNPLSCMINDDRFILQTLKNWKFGLDNTGDLMKLENMEHLAKETEKMGEVLLVTADGSIDCQEDPGEQEAIVCSLHYCEAVSALHILAKGGSFLLKMFTMYEEETICLIYLLCCSFNNVYVFKPATSKEGNSEVYVVCLEYKGREVMEPWLVVLRKHFGPKLPSKAMFPLEALPQDFLDQIYECACIYKRYQTEIIENNIRVYEEGKSREQNFVIKKLRYLVANHFMDTYEMKKIDTETQGVVGRNKLHNTMTLNMDPRQEEGSFSDRRKKTQLPPRERLLALKQEVDSIAVDWPSNTEKIKMKFEVCVDGFQIQVGKPVGTVHSSKFCLGRLLKLRNLVQELALELKPELSPRPKKVIQEEGNDASSEKTMPIAAINCSSNSKVRVLDYKEKLWTSMDSGKNEEAERDAFWEIMDVIDEMWRGDNLLLKGYPMLTQFNVGVVYMLCHLFETVEFIKPCKQDFTVAFLGFRKWNHRMNSFLDKVSNTLVDLEEKGGHHTVLALFPINKLCERYASDGVALESEEEEASGKSSSSSSSTISEGNPFYRCVTEVNNICVKEQILDIIATVTGSP